MEVIFYYNRSVFNVWIIRKRQAEVNRERERIAIEHENTNLIKKVR